MSEFTEILTIKLSDVVFFCVIREEHIAVCGKKHIYSDARNAKKYCTA